MPSYCLLRMLSRVRWKCFLLASMEADSCWFPLRLEWMSSMRPLMYLVVTWIVSKHLSSKQTERGTYRFVLLIKVVDVAVQDLNE